VAQTLDLNTGHKAKCTETQLAMSSKRPPQKRSSASQASSAILERLDAIDAHMKDLASQGQATEQHEAAAGSQSADTVAQIQTYIDSHVVATLGFLQETVARQADAIQLIVDSISNLRSGIVGETIEAIDDRISTLEDRLSEQISSATLNTGQTLPAVDSESSLLQAGDIAELPADESRLAEEDQQEAVEREPAQSGWAAIRNAFLEEDPPAPEAAKVAEPVVASEAVDPERVQEHQDSLQPIQFDIPDPVDPEQLDTEQLREAFCLRESLLRSLVGHLRHNRNTAPAITLQELRSITDHLPEELSRKVEDNLSKIDENLRLGELELSLERARIARQVSQLQSTREIIESNARRVGLSINPDGTIEGTSDAAEKTSSKSRRWLGAMGFGN
jgi:hypothetical protein